MKKIIPRHIIIKICKTNNQKNLKVSRKLHYIKRTKDKNDRRLFVRNYLSRRQWGKIFKVLSQKLLTLNSILANLSKIKDFRHTGPKRIHHHQKCITKYFFSLDLS